MRWLQLCGSLNILWHCLSLGLELKMIFSSSVATAELPKFAEIWVQCFQSIIFRTWNSSSGLSSPSLVLFIVMLPKASWLHTPGCLVLGEWPKHCGYLGRKIFFCISSVQSISCVWIPATSWTAARQASLSITNSQSLLKLVSIESVMPPNHLIFCRPLLLLPSIFPSIRVFSNESALCIRWPKY